MTETVVSSARAVFLGAPGAGKGTQAKRLAKGSRLLHISTGDMLREHVREGTALGAQAKQFMDQGQLVPDDLIIAMVRDRIGASFGPDSAGPGSSDSGMTRSESGSNPGTPGASTGAAGAGLPQEGGANPDQPGSAAPDGWILDGFPRTLPQARALDKSLVPDQAAMDAGLGLTVVVYFNVPDAALIERLTGRRTCTGCGAIWHVTFRPPAKPSICDLCSSPLVQRKDDEPEAIRKRMVAYANDTKPLLEYYRSRDLLVEIDASQSPDDVYQELLKAMP